MKNKKPQINCPVFQKQESVIRHFADGINAAHDIQRKAELGEEFKKEIDVLLNCPDYDDENLDCKNCRFITMLRKQTIDMLIKTRKLAVL